MSDEYDELKPEYDMSDFLKHGVKGKHAEQFGADTTVVILEPEISKAFPTSESVNEALRLVLQMSTIPHRNND